jgi:hypothetical protein
MHNNYTKPCINHAPQLYHTMHHIYTKRCINCRPQHVSSICMYQSFTISCITHASTLVPCIIYHVPYQVPIMSQPCTSTMYIKTIPYTIYIINEVPQPYAKNMCQICTKHISILATSVSINVPISPRHAPHTCTNNIPHHVPQVCANNHKPCTIPNQIPPSQECTTNNVSYDHQDVACINKTCLSSMYHITKINQSNHAYKHTS